MWTITELKEKGRIAFRRNYWKCVFVALIIALVTSSASSNGRDNNTNNNQNTLSPNATFEEIFENQEQMEQQREQELQDMILNGVGTGSKIFDQLTKFVSQFLPSSVSVAVSGMLMGVAGLMIAVMAIFWLIFNIIVSNVIQVGGARFFAMNSYEPINIGEIFWGFREGRFKRIVITMFLRGLFTALWTLLFIIPGIIKMYEYRMIPYLLAENPDLNWAEASGKSRELMRGQKMNAFVLDFSFIGWHLLNAITLGVSGFFYSNAYEYATDAELFLLLNDGFDGMVSQTGYQQRWQDAYDNGTVWEEGTDYQSQPSDQTYRQTNWNTQPSGDTEWQDYTRHSVDEYEPHNNEDDDRTYR